MRVGLGRRVGRVRGQAGPSSVGVDRGGGKDGRGRHAASRGVQPAQLRVPRIGLGWAVVTNLRLIGSGLRVAG